MIREEAVRLLKQLEGQGLHKLACKYEVSVTTAGNLAKLVQ